MRKKNHTQLPLMDNGINHPHAEDYERISEILDSIPTINEMVLQDLTDGVENRDKGAQGMSAEQVLRAAIIKQTEDLSYEELAFHLVDSRTYRKFCRIGISQKGFKKTALCSNIKAILPSTMENINRLIAAWAEDKKIETGKQSRIDCTVVESNIHEPSDSSLLWDCVRVLTNKFIQINDKLEEVNFQFSDHCKRAKRRMLGIMNTNKKKVQKDKYKDLLVVTEKTLGYGRSAVSALDSTVIVEPVKAATAQGIGEEIKRIVSLAEKVVDQTRRRVVNEEKVPASEKVVSIFEPHTDIIVKDRRDTFYGHKICLSGGPSNLITDCLIVEGNPADSRLTTRMLDRHDQIYGRYPRKVSLDGGFASKENLRLAKSRGIKDVCFAKKRGLKEEDMCKSSWVYSKLRRFRAGIEAGISWLKRCFGLNRCTWKSFNSFKSYVWTSIVAANLFTLARAEKAT
jgi:IS5 family transposase